MTTTPDDVLNIDDWLDGLTPPEATLDVCGSANLAARHEDLTEQLRARRRADDAVPEGDRDQSWGAGVADLTAAIDANAAAMKRASRTLRLRGLTADENDAMLEEFTLTDPKTRTQSVDGRGLVIAQVATALIEPALTRPQVEKLRKRLSVGEFTRIVSTVRDLSQGITELPL